MASWSLTLGGCHPASFTTTSPIKSCASTYTIHPNDTCNGSTGPLIRTNRLEPYCRRLLEPVLGPIRGTTALLFARHGIWSIIMENISDYRDSLKLMLSAPAP
ncbi:hypothetical protein BDV59DRAFT_180291 [Aspergillus ambiguus]|uniref:uncharacterized protein n=1 Tax=Aspergillus ambiguus TaxID=176160 RepID=UPI003CCCD042